jgi:hypothetical protein
MIDWSNIGISSSDESPPAGANRRTTRSRKKDVSNYLASELGPQSSSLVKETDSDFSEAGGRHLLGPNIGKFSHCYQDNPIQLSDDSDEAPPKKRGRLRVLRQSSSVRGSTQS